MSKGMYLNSKDLGLISSLLQGEILSTRVILKICKNKDDIDFFQRDFDRLCSLYCKIKGIDIIYLQKIFSTIDEFTKYTHVKSYGLNPCFEKIKGIDFYNVYTDISKIGWGLEERSVFENNVFYPYGIDRKDVFLEFKNI